MNKRITSLLLCFMMIVCMLVSAVPANATSTEAPITVTIDPDKTTASPGDTITYTVNVGPVKRLQSVNFTLVIPEGLTYVSGKEVDGLKELLGADKAEYTDSTKTMIVSGGGSYNSDGTTALMKFSCTVNAGTVGATLKITFEGDEDFSDDAYETYDTTYDFDSSKVTVTAAPKPATGISLNKSTLELTVGESETLVATVEPADTTDTVTWDTGRSDVATVDSTGKVTAVAPGTANITAKAGSQSASCVVTVENAPCTHTNKTPVSAKSSTCKVQGWDAYSKCNDCGQLFNKDGNAISAIPYLPLADHTPVQTATAKYLQSAATCTSPAVYYEHCSVCDVKLSTTFTSGSTVPHTESGWKSDADGHWKVCTVCGTTTTAKVAHTPDHTGHATEEYAIKCTECGYVIEAQLSHTHSLTPVAAKSATCTADGNTAYYVCSGCGKWFEDATGNVEIVDHNSVVIGHPGHDWKDATCTAPKTCGRCGETEGVALGHDFADVWSSDASKHWHACSRCDVKGDEAEHTPDREAATETDPIKCSVCDYVITPALGLQEYTIDLPFSLAVKLTGDEKPAKETFKFEIYDLGCEDAEFETVNDSITAENIAFDENGVAFIEGSLKIKVTGEDQLCNLTEGFKVRMVKGSTKGWTYASEQWYVELFFMNDALDVGIAVKEIVDGEISEVYANGMSFSVSYEAVTEPGPSEPAPTEPAPTEPAPTEPDKPGDTQEPQTGDNSMMGLWIALLFVSGVGVVGTTVYGRKKKYSVK